MIGIDWESAPEGATHFYIGSPDPWRDLSEEDWKWFADGKWHSPHDKDYSAYIRGLDLSSRGLIDRSGQYLVAKPGDFGKDHAV